MDERALAFLRELERADETVAATLAELDELAHEIDRVRVRAVELEAFAIRVPAEREALSVALADARRAADARRDDVARAEAELAEAERRGDRRRLAAARRAHVGARDLLRTVERKLAALERDRGRLEAEVEAAERGADELGRRAAELAEALSARPALAEQAGAEPPKGVAGIAEWGSRARAALFVARGRLAAEREAVIRQANELGSAVLGEPLSAASTTGVARRLEREREEPHS